MANSTFTVSQVAGIALALEDKYLGDLRDVASSGGNEIISALRDLAAKCNQLQTAEAKAAQTLADPSLARDFKLKQARQMVGAALTATQQAVQTYSDALDSAQAKLRSALVPKPPANTDGSILALRAQEVIKLLEATDSAARITTAGNLLATALANGDTAKAYILAGGTLLSDTYQRLGMKADTLQQMFANVVEQAQSSATPLAGARLLALLTHTGGSVSSLRGLRDMARTVLYHEQEGFDQSVEALVAIGGVQNGPGNVGA